MSEAQQRAHSDFSEGFKCNEFQTLKAWAEYEREYENLVKITAKEVKQ